MDRMFIDGLELMCIIGTKPEERRRKQKVVVSVSMEVDMTRPGRTDKLEDTVNYHSLEKKLIALVEWSRFQLIERLAAAVAELCLTHDRLIHAVYVKVVKPAAGIEAKSIGVEIVRQRKK